MNEGSVETTRNFNKEGITDKVWLYLGGMAVVFAIAIYAVISIVKRTNPPAYGG
ncbi:MAG: hypothetical protein U0236_16240 [Nitrospira sp.]